MGINCVFWIMSILHFTWACLLALSSEPYLTAPIFYLGQFLGGRYVTSISLLVASICATMALSKNVPPSQKAFLLIPQQMFLIIAALGTIHASLSGMFPDGTTRPHMYILTAQLPILILSVVHSISFIRKFILSDGY